jgi:predicted nucleic acid-binding protein
MALATERLEITDEAESLAESLQLKKGISPIDAVHLALASVTKADFFATCDDVMCQQFVHRER